MTIVPLKDSDTVMSSDKLLELINEARAESGEPAIRRNKLAEKIEDELAGEHYTKRVVRNLNSTESAVFDLTRDQCMLVSMRESKAVRRKVVAKLNALTSQAGFSIPKTRAEAMRLAADLEERNEALALENLQLNQLLTQPTDRHDSTFRGGLTPTNFARTLNGVNTQKINWHLSRKRWIYDSEKDVHRAPSWRVYSEARDKLLSEDAISISRPGKSPLVRYKLVLLPKGEKRIWEMYLASELPMKDSWDGEFRYSQHVEEEAKV